MLIETQTGKRGDERRDGAQLAAGEDGGAAGFIMIFKKAREVALIREIAADIGADRASVACAESIVESFVVSEIEAEIEKPSFRSPIRFREQNFLRERRANILPEFNGRRGDAGEMLRPSFGKNVIENEHGHIAAKTVAVHRGVNKLSEKRGAHGGLEMIELRHVAPGREIGIFGARDITRAGIRFRAIVSRRIVAEIVFGTLNEIIGLLENPGVIEGHVIGDKIEDEAQAAGVEFIARGIE